MAGAGHFWSLFCFPSSSLFLSCILFLFFLFIYFVCQIYLYVLLPPFTQVFTFKSSSSAFIITTAGPLGASYRLIFNHVCMQHLWWEGVPVSYGYFKSIFGSNVRYAALVEVHS